MHSIAPLDRNSPAPPARTGGAITDAFALLLDSIGGGNGDGAERQPAAPGGKRLPVAAIDPALVAPPIVAATDTLPPASPPTTPAGGRALAVPATPDAAPLPDDMVAQLRSVSDISHPPFVPSEVEGRAASVAQGVSTSLDTNGGAQGANGGTQGVRESDPVPVARRPLPGEHAAPVVTLAPPRAAEAVVAGLTRDAERDDPRDAPMVEHAGEPQPPPVVADLAPRPILAANGADNPRLDLHDDTGIQAMIDHIETLRDAGGTTTGTRIRLSPDALGEVEVVLHHGDAGVEVRFASANADAAQALADAQPRLAELAQARGVRLGGMQVDVGGGRDAPRHDRQPPAARPARIASTGAPGADPATDDIRIA